MLPSHQGIAVGSSIRPNESRLSCAASEKMKSFPNLSPRQLQALVRLPLDELPATELPLVSRSGWAWHGLALIDMSSPDGATLNCS